MEDLVVYVVMLGLFAPEQFFSRPKSFAITKK